MKKKVIMYNIFTAIIILCTSVYAAINANLNLELNSKTLHPGDEFEVTLSLKDLEGITGVDSVEGYINVDKTILEDIEFNSIVKDTNNQVKIGNETVKVVDVNESDNIEEYGIFFNGETATNDCKIVIDLKNKVTTEDLITIKFKIKDSVKEGTYSDVIKYDMFTVTEGASSQVSNLKNAVSITVSAKKDENNTNTNTNTNNNTNTNKTSNTNTNTNTNKTSNTNTNTNTNKISNTNTNTNTGTNTVNNNSNKNIVSGNKVSDNTLANKGLPAAGTANIIIKIVAVGLILGFAIYVKYKKYKNI